MTKKSQPEGLAGKNLRITAKGLAYLAAMNVGVIPRDNQGFFDGDLFNKFWDELKAVGFFEYLWAVGPEKPLSNNASEKREDRFY